MASLADLNVRIGATIKGLQTGLKNAERSLTQSGNRLSSIGQDLSAKVSLPLLGIGTAAIKAFSDFEKLEKGLGAIIGDAEKTAKELEALKEVAKNPGLGFAQAVQGSVRLQAVGFSAETSRRALAAFGNAIALVGGNASDLDGVSLALSQVASKGKISAEEINQLAERVPQIRAALQNAFGTAVSEDLQKLNISAAQFTEGVITELEKLPTAANTIGNSLNNLGQAATGFFVQVGRDLNEALNIQGVIEQISGFLTSLADRFSSLSPSVKQAIAVFGLVALALPPLITAFGSLQVAIAAAASPVTLIVAALATLTAAFTFAYNESEIFRNTINGVISALSTIASIIGGQVVGAFNFFRDVVFDLAVNGFRLLIEAANFLLTPFRVLANFLLGTATNAFEAFGFSGQTLLQNLSSNFLGFVGGLKAIFSELVTIIGEGVKAFVDGFEKVKDGDLRGALNSFADGLNKANPIGIALTQGGRLASKFQEGFNKGFNNTVFKDIRESFEKGFSGSNAVEVEIQPPSGGTFDFSGGDVAATAESAKNANKEIFDLNNNLGEFVRIVQNSVTPTTQLGEALRNNLIDNGQAEFLTRTQQAVLGFAQTSESAISPLVSIGEQLEIIANKSEVLGSAFDADAARLDLYKSSLQNLLNEGLSPQNNAITTLIDKIKELEEIEAPFKSLEESAKASARAFSSAAQQTDTANKKIGSSALLAAGKVLKAELFKSIASQLSKIFASVPFPFNLALAAGAGAIVNGLFNRALSAANVPALASGGLAFAPTLALVGDNRNAGTDPEVIAPLSKLKQFIQPNGGSGFVASTRISGSDLEIIVNRAIEQKLRTL